MGWLSQAVVVTLMFLRTIPQRAGSALAAAFGVAGVVGVMVAVLSIAEGFRATMAETGSAGNAMVLRTGADSEMSSSLGLEATRIIMNGPGVAREEDGAVASAEMFVIVDLPFRSTGTEANVPLRGVQPSAFDVRAGIEIVEGRRFEPGRNELIAGIGAKREFAGVELGNRLRWDDVDWEIVGIFRAGGGLPESELWCDVKVLQPAYRRGTRFQSVYARLESPDRFDDFRDALTSDPRLRVKVIRENEYYAGQSELLHAIITGLGSLVALLMGIGAVFGAVNTMYSAVAARTREVATLRALGFGGAPVVISVLIESLLLALAGGLVGGVAAYLAFNGYQASTLNWQSFSQVAFAFRVTPALMIAGIAVSLFLGLLGGIFPAVRAARVPVATALRQL
jgi:putative ABC transport system permease protein